MYVTPNPLTFADITKAVQRSAGLGQTCPDGTLDCLPVDTSTSSNLTTQTVLNEQAAAAEQPYYMTLLGQQVPTSNVIIGGILVAGLLAAFMFGGRR